VIGKVMTKILTLCTLLFGAIEALAQQTTVPLIVEGNAPIIELSFATPAGAVRKARFVIDTGGGAFLIGSKLMADIGAKATGPVQEAEGERFQTITPFVPMLGDMNLDLAGVRVFALADRVQASSRNNAEGLFPAALLRKYQVVFDYPAHRFTLAKPGSLAAKGIKVPSPISPKSGFPRIELQIAGTTYGFLLDTGGSFTMISRVVLESWAKANPAWPTETGAVGFANMSGGDMENRALMLRIPQVSIGPITVTNAVSREEGTFEKWMSDMMTAPIVGSVAGNVLRDFRVEIDYRNGFTYFDRSGTTADAELTSVGLVLAARPDGTLAVTGLSSKSASDVKSWVRPGDKLVAVDDVPSVGSRLPSPPTLSRVKRVTANGSPSSAPERRSWCPLR
jgi:hypothetical protein